LHQTTINENLITLNHDLPGQFVKPRLLCLGRWTLILKQRVALSWFKPFSGLLPQIKAASTLLLAGLCALLEVEARAHDAGASLRG
jgi:hypothetical protein